MRRAGSQTIRLLVLGIVLLMASLGQARGALHFWMVTGSALDTTLVRTLAERFERETGTHVEVTPLAWGSFETKYFTAMAAGLPPDVGITNLGGPQNYGSVGGLVDLRSEPEGRELERMFDPGLLTMFEVGKRLYGVPNDLSTPVLYYRKDIFARRGLRVPEKWSELNATIGALEGVGYRTYYGFTNAAQWALNLYTMPYGVAGIDVGPRVNWLDPRYQKGVAQALRLWWTHDSPGRDLGPRAIGLFRSDEPGTAVPLMIDQHVTYDAIRHDAPELAGKWGVAPWPRADDGKPYNVMGGTSFVVFRQSALRKEAMAWIRFLLSPGSQEAMARSRQARTVDLGLAIPSTRAMWSSQERAFWDGPEWRVERPLIDVLRDVVPTFATSPQLPGGVEANRLEANLLDTLGTAVGDDLDEIARSKGLAKSKLVAAFGRGEYADEKAALDRRIVRRLYDGYARIAPQAQTILDREGARYEARYGSIIGRLPELERRRNLLDTVKLAAALLVLGAVLAVAAVPRFRKHAVSYAFVAVPLGLALIFVFVPAAVSLALSFTDYHPVLPLSTAEPVGLKNYAEVLRGGDVTNSLLRTLRYAATTLPIGLALALVLAYLLNYPLRAQRLWRFLYFSPLVTSVVSIGLIFSQIFLATPQGWLNAALLRLGLVRDPVPFLTSEHTFLNAVIVLAIWQGLAFSVLVFLAGLQQVPDALYEAAELDGAGSARRFWNVALPGIRPQFFFVAVLGVIGSFQVFETIYTLANKSGDAAARFGPNDSALTMVPLVYHTAFETFEMGKSAAIAYVLFALILALTAVQLVGYRRAEARS